MKATAPNLTLLYGGTFNPIHIGHIEPVAELSRTLKPQKIIYVPCHIPPHKSLPDVSSVDRLSMTRLAVEEFSDLYACPVDVTDFEINQNGASYTATTLKYFKSKMKPNEQLGFVIGMDSLLSLTTWFQWQEIIENTLIFVMSRPGFELKLDEMNPEIKNKIGNTIHILNQSEYNISSSEIRSFSVNDSAHFLPKSVLEYVKVNHLYG